MAVFSKEVIEELYVGLDELRAKYIDLMPRFSTGKFSNEKAREYAAHGFSRRLRTMVRCIENVFAILPPEKENIPSRDEVVDVQINLQAFIFNIFGSLDNLAWLWVSEKEIKKENGSPLPSIFIGLFVKKSPIQDTFSDEFKNTLNEFRPWYKQVEDFRHALGHRIPLYVPPYTIDPIDVAEYNKLEVQAADAASKIKLKEYDSILEKQAALGRPPCVMTHSFSEGSQQVVFHAQMLADFNTVYTIGLGMAKELD
jgi:hypothetical protein